MKFRKSSTLHLGGVFFGPKKNSDFSLDLFLEYSENPSRWGVEWCIPGSEKISNVNHGNKYSPSCVNEV